jgi:hypothetical protein
MSPHPVFALVYLLMPALVVAQGQAVSEPRQATPLQVEVERSRIQRSREQVKAEAEQANAACYQKFAVTDCLREGRANNRQVLDELRRQEVILNDLERQAKAIEALNKIEEKSLAGTKYPQSNRSGTPAGH